MVALVNNAIGPSCLLPSGSGSNTADKTPEQVTYTLIDWYLHVPCTRKETLQRLANYVGCGYLLLQIHLCGWRTRNGISCNQPILEMTPISVISSRKSLQVKRGRPKLYDGKIEMEHLEEGRFEIINLENGQGRILSAVVHFTFVL